MSAYLQVVEFRNFKTLRNTRLGPFNSRTFYVFVGPNGSGKSNFVEGLAFVMGESAVEKLQVSHLKDLFNTSSSTNECSVTAVFSVHGGQRRFSRRLDSEGNEIFKIGNEIVNFEQYVANLCFLNIDTKLPNLIIHQGTITSLVELAPKEMVEFLEKACGSAAFCEAYKEQYKNVIQIGWDLKDLGLKIKYVKHFLKKTSDQQERFGSLHREVVRAEQRWLGFTLHHYPKILSELPQAKQQGRTACEKVRDEINRLRSNVRLLKGEEWDMLESIVLLQDEIKKACSEYEARAGGLRDGAEIIQKSLRLYKELLDEVSQQISGFEESKLDLERQMTENKRKWADHMERTVENRREYCSCNVLVGNFEMSRENAQSQDERDSWEEYLALKDVVAKRAFELSLIPKVFTVPEEHNFAEAHLYYLESQKESLCHQIKLKRKMAGELTLYRMTLHQRISDIDQDTCHDVDENEMEKVADELHSICDQLEDMEVKKLELDDLRERRFLVFRLQEQFGDHAVVGLFRDLLGSCGSLYPGWVAKILRDNGNSIVVDSQETAVKIRTFFHAENIEAHTFLPIKEFEMQRTDEENQPSWLGDEDDCDDYESMIRKVFVPILTEDIAISGDEYESAAAANARNQVMDEDEDELFEVNRIVYDVAARDVLKNRKERLSAELANLRSIVVRRQKADKLEDAEARESKLEALRQDLAETEEKIVFLEREIAEAEKSREAIEPEIEEVRTDLSTQKRKTLELKILMDTIEDETFKDFCQKLDVANIRQFLGQCFRCWKKNEEKKGVLERQISNIEISLEGLADQIDDAQALREYRRKRVKELSKSFAELTREYELMRTRFDADNEFRQYPLEAKRHEHEEFETRIYDCERELSHREDHLDTLCKSAVEMAEFEYAVTSDLRSALIHHRILALKGDGSASHEDSDELSEDEHCDSLSDLLNSDSDLPYPDSGNFNEEDFMLDKLPDNLQYWRHCKEVYEFGKKLYQRQCDLWDELKSFPDPEQRAKCLEKAEYDLETDNQEREILNAQIMRQREEFEETKRQRNEIFYECYKAVSENLDQSYKDLMDSNSAKARIWSSFGPEDKDELYRGEIYMSCRVPGKLALPLEFLSSGEQTMLAVAFVLAFDAYKKTPILMVDEIDANADMANMHLLGKAFQRRAKHSQVFAVTHRNSLMTQGDALVTIQMNGSARYLDFSSYDDAMTNNLATT